MCLDDRLPSGALMPTAATRHDGFDTISSCITERTAFATAPLRRQMLERVSDAVIWIS
jgi:hypothetical protein